MNQKVYFGIAIRLIMLCSIGMLFTFINPQLHTFFGDTILKEGEWDGVFVRDGYNWGARHYWYYWTLFSLFILSLINFIIQVYKLITKHYPNF
jgi:hypothetical protein